MKYMVILVALIIPSIMIFMMAKTKNSYRFYKFLTYSVMFTIIELILDFLTIYLNGLNTSIEYNIAYIIVLTLGYVLLPLVGYNLCLASTDNKKMIIFLKIIIVIYVLSIGFNFYDHWLFEISLNNEYTRGFGFPMVYVIPTLICIIFFVLEIKYIVINKIYDFVYIFLIVALLVGGSYVYYMYDVIPSIWIVYTEAIILFFFWNLEMSNKRDLLTKLFNRNQFISRVNTGIPFATIVVCKIKCVREEKSKLSLGDLDMLIMFFANNLKRFFYKYGLIYRINDYTFIMVLNKIDDNYIEESFSKIDAKAHKFLESIDMDILQNHLVINYDDSQEESLKDIIDSIQVTL